MLSEVESGHSQVPDIVGLCANIISQSGQSFGSPVRVDAVRGSTQGSERAVNGFRYHGQLILRVGRTLVVGHDGIVSPARLRQRVDTVL